MEEFLIIKPSPHLAPYIKNYWLLKTDVTSPAIVRTLPTGMMSLVFHRGNRILSVKERELHPRAFLSGHEKCFADLEYNGQINMISVTFKPTGVRAFFNLPINKTDALRLTAEELEDRELRELENSLLNTYDDSHCIRLIENFLLKRIRSISEYNLKRIDSAIRLINYGETEVSTLANAACLSTKQFNRIFSEIVGSNPKEFSRTIRFQRALYTLENKPQISLIELAYECGYYDQSHLIREFKAYSGYTPTEYLAICPHIYNTGIIA